MAFNLNKYPSMWHACYEALIMVLKIKVTLLKSGEAKCKRRRSSLNKSWYSLGSSAHRAFHCTYTHSHLMALKHVHEQKSVVLWYMQDKVYWVLLLYVQGS